MLLALNSTSRRPVSRPPNRPELRFHYTSWVAGGVSDKDLAQIVHASWRNNWRFGITGWLCLDGCRFEQVMEGEAETLSYLVAAILADGRHEAIDVEGFSVIEARSHDCWTFEGFQTALRSTHLLPEKQDTTNLVHARFGSGR